jgi:hypothetical protein
MEFELEDGPQQMGEEDFLSFDEPAASPQRERRSYSRPARVARSKQDQALFIPEQEAGIG